MYLLKQLNKYDTLVLKIYNDKPDIIPLLVNALPVCEIVNKQTIYFKIYRADT